MNRSNEKCCPECGSKDIISDEEILPYCDDCGFILNQRKAKKQFEQQIEEWESAYLI